MTYQRNETPEPLASGALSAFEEMMPEPHWYSPSGPCDAAHFPYYTADQMRQMFEAATERATKAAFVNALDKAYDAMFHINGCKVTRFDAQTAIARLKEDAAAIRPQTGGEV